MAYAKNNTSMVTATRRRPQRFCDLVGQEFVAATLENSIKRAQIANAYLFSGPRGCGKTSSARILAKSLNCKAGDVPQVTPCGVCESCRAIAASSSMDVIEIDGASNTSVNDVRAIKDEVMFPPNSSRYKIYIIDEVHMLSTSAFNALLKTIEEPPPYVVFIFATTELQKVPATIKSRCQQFNFRLVNVEKIKDLLSDACKELGITYEDEGLYWIAKESGGSVRDSYTLFDQVASFSDGHITYDKIRDKLGLVGVESLNAIMLECCAGNAKGALECLDKMLSSGVSIETVITSCTEYLRSILLIKNGVTKESLLSAALNRYDTKIIQSWGVTQSERALSIFLQLYRNTRYTINARYETELAFSLLSCLKDYVAPSEVKKALDATAAILQDGVEAITSGNVDPATLQSSPSFNSESVKQSDTPYDSAANNSLKESATSQTSDAQSITTAAISSTTNAISTTQKSASGGGSALTAIMARQANTALQKTQSDSNKEEVPPAIKEEQQPVTKEDSFTQNNNFSIDNNKNYDNITTVSSSVYADKNPATSDITQEDDSDDESQARYVPPLKKHNALKRKFDSMTIK